MPQPDGLSWDEIQQSWAGFFKSKVFFSYARCDGCGLLYCPQYFTEEQLSTLYASMADNTAGLGTGVTGATQSGYVSAIRSAPEGDFFELGPDIGLFTRAYAERFDPGRRKRYWLYEPNRAVHRELGERMQEYDLVIRAEFRDWSEVPDRSIGTAVMVHVLDHLLDPMVSLRDIHRKMRPGGMVHIVTHNEGSLLARALRRRWPAYCLQHPQLFRPETIRRMLTNAGFEVQEVRRTTNYFPAGYLMQHGLYSVMKWNIPWLARIAPIAVGLKLGNMLTTACRPD